MSVVIREINTRRELKKFISFADRLYRDCPYYCPPIRFDEMNTFDRKKNPAMDVCDFQLFMAFRDGKAVGRIAALVNNRANEFWKEKKVRFRWFDFIDDMEVSHALLDAVRDWGRQRGLNAMNGPLGFTDWDHEGLLIEGYDYVAPLASLYNYPYYVKHFEAYGLTKDVDWIEMQVTPPKEIPERLVRMEKIVRERSKVHVVKFKNRKEMEDHYGLTYMDVLDQAYQSLHNFQPLTDRQKKYYNDMYFPLLNMDFLTIVANEKDEVVGIGVGMPDISKAVRRCHGRLFPFGWLRILRALKTKRIDVFDTLLIAVRPDYQNTGINILFFTDQIPYFNKYHVRYFETTSILESNMKSLSQFYLYEHKFHKRRRAYIMDI